MGEETVTLSRGGRHPHAEGEKPKRPVTLTEPPYRPDRATEEKEKERAQDEASVRVEKKRKRAASSKPFPSPVTPKEEKGRD